jgi:glycerophosphoryl diester phosphodiesterase
MKRAQLLPGQKRPLIFAHRGCSSLAPENTLASFKLAREKGSPGIELDIHRCASGELVVIHDDNLKRTTGLDKIVEDATLSEIRELDAGSWFDPAFEGERVPLLDEVLDEFVPGTYIDIELKSRKKGKDPFPGIFARALKEREATFRSRHPDAGPLSSWITVSSFNPLTILAFKKEAPDYATSIIWCADTELPVYLRRGEGRWISRCDYLKPRYDKATTFSHALLSVAGGRPMVPWVVDDPALARTLIERGCAGVITNRPQDIVPALR